MVILAETGGASFGSKASTDRSGEPSAKIMGETGGVEGRS